MKFPRPCLLFLLLTLFLVAGTVRNTSAQTGPHLLIDAKTGNVIAKKDARKLWPPASLTKLMTAYTVFREIRSGRISVKSPVRISAEALALPPSKMGFPVGTILSMDAALKIIMVKSANDVAHALGQSTLGSEKRFVAAMNAHATRLGMSDSHFTNPHGLPDFEQYTSARDMGLLALALQNEFPEYAGYFNISHIKIGKKRLRNHNRLLFHIEGANGMKTGYICASGLNIVARAMRADKTLISVVLGGRSSVERNVEAARLFDHGFSKPFPKNMQHLEAIQTARNYYRLPANFTPQICKPTWAERQMSKKQRKAARRQRLGEIEDLRKKFFSQTTGYENIVTVKLGEAFGPNPFGYRMKDGGTPPPIIPTPKKRPEKTELPAGEDIAFPRVPSQ